MLWLLVWLVPLGQLGDSSRTFLKAVCRNDSAVFRAHGLWDIAVIGSDKRDQDEQHKKIRRKYRG